MPSDEDFHPHPAAVDDGPVPIGQQLVIPPVALFAIVDLHPVRLSQIAAFLTTAAATLRRHPPAPMDGCLNRGTCTLNDPKSPACLLCALDAAIVRHLPDGANTATACDIVNTGTIAKQLIIDVMEANPRHGGEVFVTTHIAELIRSGALADAAHRAVAATDHDDHDDTEGDRALRAEYADATDPASHRDGSDL